MTRRWLALGVVLGLVAGVTLHQARAGADDDSHRAAVALEQIAHHLESIDRHLERCKP